MSERFVRLNTLPCLYAEKSPVLIEAGALLKDNSSGRVLAQLKFKNLSDKIINCLTVKINTYDSADRLLETNIVYQYLDIQAVKYSEFGSKVPIYLNDSSARSFKIGIKEAIFNDKSVLDLSEKIFESVPRQELIANKFKEPEVLKQYKIETCSDNQYVPERYKDLYRCSCGCISKEEICPFCGSDFHKIAGLLNVENLTEKKNERLRKEAILAKQRRIKEAELSEQRRKEIEKNKRIIKKAVKLTTILIIILPVLILLCMSIYKNINYQRAKKCLNENNAFEAIGILIKTNDIKDSADLMRKNCQLFSDSTTVSADGCHTVGLKSDGTVIATNYTHNSEYFDYGHGQCNVQGWKDIVAVSAGSYHTVGLKSDGTVVATNYTGEYYGGQCDVQDWTDIVAISAGSYNTVGLKSDGTVVATNYVGDNKYYYGQCDVRNWTDIVAISAGCDHTVGLKSDGTVVTTGNNIKGQCNVQAWTDIVAISAGNYHTVGLKSDGTVIATGSNVCGRCDVQDWTDIVAVSAGGGHTVGLKSDGTVIATNYTYDRKYYDGQCDVQNWTNIVAVSAGSMHTVGLKSDGTVVTTNYVGDSMHYYGQCDVQDWKNIKVIK